MTIDVYLNLLSERVKAYGLMKLVDKTGLSFRSVQQVARNTGNPRVETLRAIEKGLGHGDK